jgi:hypothetical protein
MRGMNVGSEAGEEIGAGFGRGGREEAVEVAAEFVWFGGEAWWTGWVDECTAGFC